MDNTIDEMLKTIIVRLDRIENLLKCVSSKDTTVDKKSKSASDPCDYNSDEDIPEDESYDSDNEFCGELSEFVVSKKNLLTPEQIRIINEEYMNAVQE
jgi:hypothetical protein